MAETGTTSMHTEIELKLLLAPEQRQKLMQSAILCNHSFDTVDLDNTYFDTPDCTLHSLHAALRIRSINGQYVQTLKSRGVSQCGLSHRQEWEWPLAHPVLDLTVLHCPEIRLRDSVDFAALQPCFRTDFQRTQTVIAWSGATIELAIDYGEVKAGEQSEVISELELELKSGPEKALATLAKTLAATVPLTPFDTSKAQRGYALLGCCAGTARI